MSDLSCTPHPLGCKCAASASVRAEAMLDIVRTGDAEDSILQFEMSPGGFAPPASCDTMVSDQLLQELLGALDVISVGSADVEVDPATGASVEPAEADLDVAVSTDSNDSPLPFDPAPVASRISAWADVEPITCDVPAAVTTGILPELWGRVHSLEATTAALGARVEELMCSSRDLELLVERFGFVLSSLEQRLDSGGGRTWRRGRQMADYGGARPQRPQSDYPDPRTGRDGNPGGRGGRRGRWISSPDA